MLSSIKLMSRFVREYVEETRIKDTVYFKKAFDPHNGYNSSSFARDGPAANGSWIKHFLERLSS